jgi:hypothetical protein
VRDLTKKKRKGGKGERGKGGNGGRGKGNKHHSTVKKEEISPQQMNNNKQKSK